MSVSESGEVCIFTACVTLLVFILLFYSLLLREETTLHLGTGLAVSCISLSLTKCSCRMMSAEEAVLTLHVGRGF